MAQTLRLFIAIELPKTVHNSIRSALLALQKASPRNAIRWVPPENLHLTLKFLGDTPQHDLLRVQGHLRQALEGFTSFDIEVSGAGSFPDGRKPRIIWLGLKDTTGQLASLQDKVEAAMLSIGYTAEARPFKAHLTVGRVRQGLSVDTLQRIGQGIKQAEIDYLALWSCQAVQLMQSELKADGAIYSCLTQIDLV